MRLTTWNVNGIRNPFSYQPWNSARTFPAMFDILGSDIVVMQELKIQRKDLRDDMVMLDGWDCYFSLPKHKKGYSGVGIYTRNATCSPIRAEEGLLGVLPSPSGVPYCDLPEEASIGGYPSALQVAELGVDPALLDAEGRCLVLEFPAFVLLGVYSPANSNGLRDDFRYGFICALDCRIRNLSRAGKRVVLVGDLNVSRDESDTASAAEDMRKAGITHEDYISTPNRRIFNQLLLGGEVAGERDEGREHGILWDTTRALHPERQGMYTHWEQKINARPGNFGSRIDFVLVCESMQSWVKDANIQEGLLGSDHCPVYVDFRDEVDYDGENVHMVDKMNPSGMFRVGARLQDWKVSDVPAFSAKKLPEFDKRRSILSMFSAPKPSKHTSIANVPKGNEGRTDVSIGNVVAKLEQTKDPSPVKVIPSSPTLKRKASIPEKAKPRKRQVQSDDVSSSRGQQSLKGFFQKRIPSRNESQAAEDDTQASEAQDVIHTPGTPAKGVTASNASPSFHGGSAEGFSPAQAGTTLADGDATPHDDGESLPSLDETSPSKFSAKLATVEASQKSWSTLFARPVAPLCEGHSEPCKTMQTKKKGSNQGRSFWMCARPLGPSGNKEKGTQWRCPTFIWCSDWQSKKGDG